MKKHELSKSDFDKIDEVLSFYIHSRLTTDKAEQLKDLFAKAHTGWLEMEEE